MPERTIDRVTRLLAVLGYLSDHDDVAVSDLAEHFGVSEAQILTDIDLLWVTGTPGYFPDDLIDFTLDHAASRVSLREGRGIDRKIRLAPREAIALATAVQWMRAAGMAESAPALESLAAKFAALVPAVVQTASAPELRTILADAINEECAVAIEYVSAEDERSERVILPALLSTDGAAWYVEGWCALAGAPRTFRLDRILAIRRADDDEQAHAEESRQRTARDSGGNREVTIVVDPSARYIAEDLPGATITSAGDGVRARLTVGRTDWLVRLALGGAVRSIDSDLAADVRARAADAVAAYRTYDADRMSEGIDRR